MVVEKKTQARGKAELKLLQAKQAKYSFLLTAFVVEVVDSRGRKARNKLFLFLPFSTVQNPGFFFPSSGFKHVVV